VVSSTTVYVGSTQTFSAASQGTSQSATASCSSGHVLGGGAIIGNPSGAGAAIAAVVASNPTPTTNGSTATGWSVTGTIANSAVLATAPTITAYVVCG
jgi:hypothetical protein